MAGGQIVSFEGTNFEGLIDSLRPFIPEITLEVDWSSWLENLIRKGVSKMAWTSEDWMKNVFGPLIAAAMPALIEQIPAIIKAIIEAFSALTPEKKGEVLSRIVGILPGK